MAVLEEQEAAVLAGESKLCSFPIHCTVIVFHILDSYSFLFLGSCEIKCKMMSPR